MSKRRILLRFVCPLAKPFGIPESEARQVQESAKGGMAAIFPQKEILAK